MPSPFPGMDPYLEAPRRWLEFHNHLAAEICAALNQTLDARYVASLTSSVAYQAVEITPPCTIQPDVAVLRSTLSQDESPAGVATLAPAPVESSIPWEVPLTLYRVEILTTPDPDVPLDLQAAVTSAYERGALARKIDYQQPPPPPPLSSEETEWLQTVLCQQPSPRH